MAEKNLTHQELEILLRKKFLGIVYAFFAIVVLSIGIFNVSRGTFGSGGIDIATGIVALIILLVIRFYKNLSFVSYFIFVLLFVVLVSDYLVGGVDEVSVIWLSVVPILSFFLFDKKQAAILSGGFAGVMILLFIFYPYLGGALVEYNWILARQAGVAYVIVNLTVWFYKLASEQKEKIIESEVARSGQLTQDLEKFKLAVDNSSNHIVITDDEGVILYGNASAERITGYTVKSMLGKKSEDLWQLPFTPDLKKQIDGAIRQKKLFMGEIKNRRKNGEEYEASLSLIPIVGPNGKIEFFSRIERDISREKAIDKAKTEFVSLASHQLRTPLSAINWYAEMLLDGDAGPLNPTQKQYLDEIYHGNQRMVELVNSLLDVSRLELGTFAVAPEDVNVREIADGVVSEMVAQIETKKLKVIKDYGAELPEKYSADPQLFRMILQNLISNAVKYTPADGQIIVSGHADKKNIKISVADTGYGIPQNQQSKIFGKLFRADNVQEYEVEGTGLGLYIIKSVVENVGGKIWFESVENKGTTFFVELPLAGMKPKAGVRKLGQ